MKKLLALALLCFMVGAPAAFSADYYVATNGKDSNKGTLKAPFRTIQHAVEKLKSGDVCYIREGIYRENVVINKSNVKLAAYNGEYVVVSGADLVENWQPYKGEIYRAKVDGVEPQFSQVLYRGRTQDMARYPDHNGEDMFTLNDGYAPLEVKAYGEVLFDETLPGGVDYWKGGYFRAISAKAGATNPNGRIVASSGRTLQCEEISSIWQSCSEGKQVWKAIGKGMGYIYHLNALSRPGEWWYEDGYLYFWQPAGTPFGGKPAAGAVEIQKREYTITVENQKNVTLEGLNVRLASIKLNKVKDCKVVKSTFRDLKGWIFRKSYGHSFTELGGVYVNGENVSFNDCYFAKSWGNLLNLEKSNKVNIDNCIFENNGWMGFFTSCILNNSDNVKITNSTFGSTGRFHVRSDGHLRLDMLHNDLSDCMKMCQDAGSIELTNTSVMPAAMDMKGSQFAYNKFHDMNTLPAWSKEDTQYVLALYFEGAENYTVHHNLFYNITNERGDGAFVYLGPRFAVIKDCYFVNNTVWNIDYRIRVWNIADKKTGEYGGADNVQFVNNIFMSGMKNMLGIPSLEEEIIFSHNAEVDKNYAKFYFENIEDDNFKLKAKSPAVDAGVKFKGVTDGFKGKAPDVGCYEYGVKPWECGAKLVLPKFTDEK